MNTGKFTFIIDIPPHFERDVRGRPQAGVAGRRRRHGHGAGRHRLGLRAADHPDRDRRLRGPRASGASLPPVNLAVRIAFNPNVTTAWFTSVMGIINSVTMLAIILAGAAVVREREHGTMDHLLVMPITPVRDRHVQDPGERPGHHRGGRPVAAISWCASCSASPSPDRCRSSWSASCSTSSSPRRSASSWRPSRAPCRSSACSTCWSPSR